MSRLLNDITRKSKTITDSEVDNDLELVREKSSDDDILTASLHNLQPEDIDLKKETPAKKKKTSGALARRMILIVCSVVFVACAVYLAWNFIEKYRGKEFYDDAADQFGSVFEDSDGDGAISRMPSLRSASTILCLKDRLAAGDNPDNMLYNSDSRIDEMRAKLTSMKESYPDLYGWIYIDGTTINYPVVQGTDNQFYLNASPTKSPLVNGSIFTDYRNNRDIMRNFNTIMYGHNLTGGGMFHDVQASFYENEEKFRNSLIYVYTMDGAFVYEPFAVYATLSSYHYFRTEFATTDAFVEWANEMKSNSVYMKDDITFSASDRIITLSTCTNNVAGDGRFALQAKLVQVIR